jgi:hypothetical protein
MVMQLLAADKPSAAKHGPHQFPKRLRDGRHRSTSAVRLSDAQRPQLAQFFVGVFDAFPLRWSGLHPQEAKALAKGEVFFLVTGRYDAETKRVGMRFGGDRRRPRTPLPRG